jgi:hypothetical protein
MKLQMLILTALLAAAPAFSDERPGPHGGHIGKLGPFYAELITSDKVVDLYVTDSSRKDVEVTGYKGMAYFTVSGTSENVALEPSDDKKKLTGTASISLPRKVRGSVELTTADGQTHKGRLGDD